VFLEKKIETSRLKPAHILEETLQVGEKSSADIKCTTTEMYREIL